MLSKRDVDQILDPIITGTLEANDARIGTVEARLSLVIGLNCENEAADAVWYEYHRVLNDMWTEVTKCAFWAGYDAGKRSDRLA